MSRDAIFIHVSVFRSFHESETSLIYARMHVENCKRQT